jgi:hypothetical protein
VARAGLQPESEFLMNHTVAIWQELHVRFTEHTSLAAPPVAVLSALSWLRCRREMAE